MQRLAEECPADNNTLANKVTSNVSFARVGDDEEEEDTGTEIESRVGKTEKMMERKEYSADPNERDDGAKSDEPGLSGWGCGRQQQQQQEESASIIFKPAC